MTPEQKLLWFVFILTGLLTGTYATHTRREGLFITAAIVALFKALFKCFICGLIAGIILVNLDFNVGSVFSCFLWSMVLSGGVSFLGTLVVFAEFK